MGVGCEEIMRADHFCGDLLPAEQKGGQETLVGLGLRPHHHFHGHPGACFMGMQDGGNSLPWATCT